MDIYLVGIALLDNQLKVLIRLALCHIILFEEGSRSRLELQLQLNLHMGPAL